MKLQILTEIEIADDFGRFQEVELKVREAVSRSGRELLNQVMERYESEVLKRKRFWKKDLREKRFQTMVGEVKRKRWRVFDGVEQQCRYPLDEWMGVGKDKATPGLREAIVTAVVQRPYAQATKEVEQWTGVKRSPMANWKLVQGVARHERGEEPPVPDWYLKPIPRLDSKLVADPCPILAIDPDATYVKNRNSAEPDHEVKMAVMYTGKVPENPKRKRWRLFNRQVVISRSEETVRDFFNRTTHRAMGYYGAHRQTIVPIHGDGDQWIKGLKENYWDDQAIPRLDPWHVMKKIRIATGLRELPPEWIRSIYGKPDLLITQLQIWKVQRTAPHSPEREKMEELIGYLKNNREGLLPSGVPREIKQKYPRMFLRGSGTIESQIGHGLASRFKDRRMSWSRSGLDNLSYLREKFLNKNPQLSFQIPEPVGRKNWRRLAKQAGL